MRAAWLAQAPKEKNMKRKISLRTGLLGLLALATLPFALAQTPAPANVGSTARFTATLRTLPALPNPAVPSASTTEAKRLLASP